MRTYRIAVIPGDGIGPEVITECSQTLTSLASVHGGFQFDFQHFNWGTEYYLREGVMMPKDGLTTLEQGGFDGILVGPVGDTRLPDHVTLWGLLLPLRQTFDQYINLRPVRLLPGVRSPLAEKHPRDIDIVCIRENTEGEYAGAGGRVHQGMEHEVAIQSTIFTRQGTERIMRYAFEYARQYGRKKVTSATKSNSMQYNMVFWDDIFRLVAADYPDIQHEQQLIDSLSARFVSAPESLDVVVASNLFGDILTDLGAAISGSMGLAPSANLNPERRYPSLFQAIHGSAPDIVGKGIANPLASIWSGQLLLDFLGEHEAATLLMGAIEEVLARAQVRTPDLGGTATTHQLGHAIREQMRSMAVQ
jgi:tartrate dehydrogenase/decarboxylase/D-malate dehydrogenase